MKRTMYVWIVGVVLVGMPALPAAAQSSVTAPSVPPETPLGDYARTSDPFSKLGKAQVAVEVSSVIRASADSFRVGWVERHYVDDALTATERWSAILTLVLQIPTDADRLKKNPLGVYVHALNWSKELG